MKYQLICKASVCVLALSLLAGCGAWDSVLDLINPDRAEQCPDAKVLAGASSLPAFDPAKDRDPTNLVYSATMTSAHLSCSYRKKQNRAKSNIDLVIHAVRPTGGHQAVYRVPYFVALTTNGRVLEKNLYWQELTFPEGVSDVDAEASVEDIKLKPTRGKKAINYHYVLGFQLTPAQIEYTKKMGYFEP